MFEITVSDRSGRLDRLLARSEKNLTRALVAGINRTAQAGQTAAIRAVQKDLGTTSQRRIRAAMYVKKASAKPDGRTEAAIGARSTKKHRIPVYDLGARPRTVAYRPTSPGITYGPKNRLLPKTFIARMQSGHIGVFFRLEQKVRMQKGRYAGEIREPIVEAKGPLAALVMGRRPVRAEIDKVIDERLGKEVDQALQHFMK